MSDNRENKHNEEPHDSEEEKYSFLQETVKDEQRSKKGIMGNLCRLAGKGLIFGLAAGLAFYALRPWAMTHLGGEKVTIPLDQEETPIENETDTKDQEAQEKGKHHIHIYEADGSLLCKCQAEGDFGNRRKQKQTLSIFLFGPGVAIALYQEVAHSNGCEISHIYKNLKQKGSRL